MVAPIGPTCYYVLHLWELMPRQRQRLVKFRFILVRFGADATHWSECQNNQQKYDRAP
jgi:hypothetical protein